MQPEAATPTVLDGARRILVVRLDNLGDVVLTSPFARALARAVPRAELTLLASPGGAAASALVPWYGRTIPVRAVWQDLAAVRAGLLLVDTASLADMRRRLEPAAEPTRSFRHTARELLALSAWRNHDAAAARKYLDMIAGDAESPIGVRARADVLSALITADGKS